MLFDKWQQRVFPWGHIGATLRMRLNLCILRPTRVRNRNGKWIASAIFAQLTTESAYDLQWAPVSTRIMPLPMGDLDLSCDLDRWCNTMLWAYASPQRKRHLDRFSRVFKHDRGCPYTWQWFSCFPLKITLSHVGIWTSWFIGPHRCPERKW